MAILADSNGRKDDSSHEVVASGRVIRGKFIPAIVGGVVTDDEAEIFSLPVNKGGMAVTDPVRGVRMAHEISQEGSRELLSAFRDRREIDVQEHRRRVSEAKKTSRGRRSEEDTKLRNALEKLTADRRRAIEPGSPQWLPSYYSELISTSYPFLDSHSPPKQLNKLE
ncbi:hypothetical protein GE061_014032 [Apolygus lucorum]|uniref:Uncharacterized protein n=1 Tax=Apolygus lucorum TaxID=248454 RepID=A0A8S9XPF9_APOLU|nr:hypothetical protein GE061_014032 [Apolygus lucorum]